MSDVPPDPAPPAADPAAEPAAPADPATPGPSAPPASGGCPNQDPSFQLKLEPNDFIVFKTDKFPPEEGAAVEIKLTNTTRLLQCYKVKCTSNEIFRVRPPLGYVKPDQTVIIKFFVVASTAPDASKHFFAFYHIGAEDDTKTARQFWTPSTKADGVHRVPVKFLKNDGTPWTAQETSSPAAQGPTTSAPQDGAASAA